MAEGNPLFVEQLLAMLAEGGDPERVPVTIHALLAARLDSLPFQEVGLLERAAVVGLEFDWEALGELGPDRHRPSGAQLAALVRKELIRPHEVIEDTFRFRHVLIRDTAYERIPKELRAELHERFAHWLGGRGNEFEEIIGYHLEQAYTSLVGLGRPGDRARALAEEAAERLAASGRRALARGDTPAAANLLERAASLLPQDDSRRLSLLAPLGRALRDTGQLARAVSVLTEAVERAREASEHGVAADAVALSVLRLHTAPQEFVGQALVIRELEGAIPVLEELGDEAALARALTVAGMVRYWRGEVTAAIKDLERAARLGREVGDRAQEAESLQYVLQSILVGPMPVDEALRRFAELRPRAQSNRVLEMHFLRLLPRLEAMRGRFRVARDLVAQAKALAEELGLEIVLARIAVEAGSVELLAGDAAAAERELRAGCQALERMGDLNHLASVAPMLADALVLQGRDEEALLLTERWSAERLTVPEDADAQIRWRSVRAKVLARAGNVEAAEYVAHEATALAERTEYLDLHAQAVADLSEVLRRAGRPEEASTALREAIRLYEQKGNVVAAQRLHGVLIEPSIEV